MSNEAELAFLFPGDGEGFFSHTKGASSETFYTAIALAIFSIPIIILRLWTSMKIVNKWHPDDTLAAIATMFAIFQTINACICARLGTGDHILNLTLKEIHLVINVNRWTSLPLYNVTTLFIKASVLAFYLRFTVDVYFKICNYFVLAVVIANCLVNVITTSIWGKCSATLQNDCQQTIVVQIVSAALNVATDIAILLLPFWLLRPMKVPLGRKIGIALILMAGGFVFFVSIFRLIATTMISEDTDPTYGLGNALMWSVIEAWAGLICACLPCIKPFLSRYFPSFPLWALLQDASYGSRRPLATISEVEAQSSVVEIPQRTAWRE